MNGRSHTRITHSLTNDLGHSLGPGHSAPPRPSAPAHTFITHRKTNDKILPFLSSDFSIKSVGKIGNLSPNEENLCNLFVNNRLQALSKNYPPSREWFPPFSLFREFVAWLIESNKQFTIIGNQNAITYKEIFPLIKDNRMWLGKGFNGGAAHFISPYQDIATAGDHKEGMIRVSGVMWFTNIEHGRRHQPLQLMTMADNIKYSKHKEIKGIGYQKYENYNAIEVPFSDAIPSDYSEPMGVPITFLDKFCPEQFEILGMCENEDLYGLRKRKYTSEECRQAYLDKFGKKGTYDLNASGVIIIDGRREKVYQRILIRKKQ